MRQLLFIAFFYPPYSGGSGVHRASNFARYLPENGWNPHVLTVHCRAYERVDAHARKEQSGQNVIQAFALDAYRHLAVRGRYLRWSSIPDRWSSWVIGAVPVGLATVYKKNVELILVTFPISTAVLIGLILHYLTGKPLVVDFRDSMTEDEYPRDPTTRAVHRTIEKAVVRRAARLIFTTKLTREMYLKRYPELPPSKAVVIPNGYDESDFNGIDSSSGRGHASPTQVFRFVHAGLLYPDERDPRAFFAALRTLKQDRCIDAKRVRFDLRASGSEDYYSYLLRQFEIEDLVNLLAPLPHVEALRDTAAADALLLFQAASCNHQVPAKVYEYLRLQRPILALTPALGDSAALLEEVGGATIVDLADEKAIVAVIPEFIASVLQGIHPLPQRSKVEKYSRKNGTVELARCLDQLISRGTLSATP